MATGNFSTMVPISYISQTGTAWTTTTVGNIDEGVASYDGAYIQAGANSTSTILYNVATSVPADFASLLTLNWNVRYRITPLSNDTESLQIGIYTNTGGYALANVATIANTTTAIAWTTSGSTAFTGVVTSYGASYFSTGIDIQFTTTHTKSGGNDNSIWYIDAVEITGTYTKVNYAPTIVLGTPADDSELTDTTPDLKMTATDADSDAVEYEVKIDTQSDFLSQSSASQLIDSWTTYTTYYQNWTGSGVKGRGQTFTAAIDAVLTSAQWRCSANSTIPPPTGYMYARIYSYPGASLLATSDPVDVAYMSGAMGYKTFTFSGANQISMSAGTGYMVGFTWEYWAVADQISWQVDDTESKPGSYTMVYSSGVWSSTSYDIIYRVYGTQKSPLYYKKSVLGDATFTSGHPFSSGVEITYTPPTLTGYEYFWKARAYDPSGSNTFSSWTTSKKFHYGTESSDTTPAYTEGFHATYDSHVHAYMNCTASSTATAPTVEIITPSGTSTSDTTPALYFCGIDINNNEIEFEIQIDTSSSFDSVDTIDLKAIYMPLTKVGTPSDGIYIEIHSGSPSGTLLGTSGTISATYIETWTVSGWTNVTFSTALSLSRSTQYYAVMRRTSTRSTSNYYYWLAAVMTTDNTNGYAYVRNSSSWTSYSTYDRYCQFRTDSWPSGTGWDDYYFTIPETPDSTRWPLYGDSSSGTNEMLAQSFTTPAPIPLYDVLSHDLAGFYPSSVYYTTTQIVRYTVQTALTIGTWYWRVRAIDKGGGNTYGSWTSAQTLYIVGSASGSKHGYLEGVIPRGSTDAYIAGKTTALSDTPCCVTGCASTTTSAHSYVSGITGSSSDKSAYIANFPEPAFQYDAFQTDAFQALGYWRGFTHVYLDGETSLITIRGSSEVYITGISDASDSQVVYVKGGINSLDNQPVYLGGQSSTADSVYGYILGNSTAMLSCHGYTSGTSNATTNKSAFSEGAGAETSSSSEAFMQGNLASQDSQYVYLSGAATPVMSDFSAYIHGSDTESSQSPCYTSGLLRDSTTAFVEGNTLSSSHAHACTTSLKEDVSLTMHAYLSGVSRASTEAYLAGQIVGTDYIWLKTSDGSLAKKFIVLKEEYSGGDKEKPDTIIRTIGGGSDQSLGASNYTWDLVIRVKHTESENDYGTLADLEYFYELKNPLATPSNTIIFINHHQYEYRVRIIGRMTKNLIGTQVEGQEAIYLYRLQLVEVG